MNAGLRAFDHLVVPTRDLDGLAASFAALGFQVGATNRHPWGTENRIVQFPGSFLELIGLADGFVGLPEVDPAEPFAGFVKRYVGRYVEGLGMMVLRTHDAAADAHHFEARGIGHGRMLPFSRGTQGPDGRERIVAFTIAFAAPATMPDVGAFTCKQHRPENFWNPSRQVHGIGATALLGCVIVAPVPEKHAPFLTAFTGQDANAIPGGLAFALDGGRIEVITPDAFATRFEQRIALHHGSPRIGAALIAAPVDGPLRVVRPTGSDIILALSPPI